MVEKIDINPDQDHAAVPIDVAMQPDVEGKGNGTSVTEDAEEWSDSPDNPHNWSNGRRWGIAMVVAASAFISTCGSSIIAPAIHDMTRDLVGPNGNEQLGIMVTSVYVLGMGFGPFLLSPLAEIYGRQPAYLISMAIGVVFNAACCASTNIHTLIILRLFSGIFLTTGTSLGVPVLGDMFKPKDRGRPMAIYTIGPMLGPAAGSMFGVWLLALEWRWILGVFALMNAAVTIAQFLFMRETYHPVLLAKRAYYVEQGFSKTPNYSAFSLDRHRWMVAIVSADEIKATYRKAFVRPPKLLFTNMVALSFSLYYSYLYGILYVFIICIPMLFGRPPFSDPSRLFAYQWSENVLALAYMGLLIGFLTASFIAAMCQDRLYRYFCKRNGDNGQPEYRLVMTQIGMILFPIGLLMFGWTAHAQTFWLGPLVGMIILSIGLMMAWNSLQNFFVDAFHPYSAAALTGAIAMRSILGAVLPLYTPQLWRALGWGWGGTMLAGVAAVAIPLPGLMFYKGKEWRERQKFTG